MAIELDRGEELRGRKMKSVDLDRGREKIKLMHDEAEQFIHLTQIMFCNQYRLFISYFQ